jgi:hypothetical protein
VRECNICREKYRDDLWFSDMGDICICDFCLEALRIIIVEKRIPKPKEV